MPHAPDDVAVALLGGVGVLMRRIRQLQVPGELTQPEAAVLSRLDREGPLTTAELARAENVRPQSMSATVAAVEQRGLVARDADPRDGRRVLIDVTAEGRDVARRKRSVRAEQIAAGLSGSFTAAELTTLAEAAPLLERLGRSL